MSKPSFDLSNKVAIVTGGSRGIGFAIAQTFLESGARVVISSRKSENLSRAVESLQSYGEVFPVVANASDPAAIKELVRQSIERFSGIDILVNNAATNPHFGPLLTADDGVWDKTMDVNLKGYFRLIRACVESMDNRGGGKIINIASVNGLRGQAGMGIYSISKAAVLMLTQVLAIELAPQNIQVNAIAPGLVETHFSRLLWETPQIQQIAIHEIPQRRIGQPDELTGIALYLASSASSYTTGATFVVDGGQLAGGSYL